MLFRSFAFVHCAFLSSASEFVCGEAKKKWRSRIVIVHPLVHAELGQISIYLVPCRIRKLCMYAIDPIVYFRRGCAVVGARQGDCSEVDTLFS